MGLHVRFEFREFLKENRLGMATHICKSVLRGWGLKDKELMASLGYMTPCLKTKQNQKRAGEMAQWLRTPVVLTEVPGLSPSTHMEAVTLVPGHPMPPTGYMGTRHTWYRDIT